MSLVNATVLPVTLVDFDGTAAVGAAADLTNGNIFQYQPGKTWLVVKAGGSPSVVTITLAQTVIDGITATQQTTSVGAGKSYSFANFPPVDFQNTATAGITIYVTCSAAATLAVYQM